MEKLKGAAVCAMLALVFGMVLHVCMASRSECATAAVGCTAPDFELKTAASHAPVRVSDLRGKPLVLVFGSTSCSYMQNSMLEVKDMFQAFSDKARFLIVYTKEAHPAGEKWGSPQPVTHVPQAVTMDQRDAAAAEFANHLEAPIPVVVDTMDNRVSRRYDTLPTKLLILDSSGKIAFIIGKSDSYAHGTATAELRKLFNR